MDRSDFFYKRFRNHFQYELTPDQDRLFSEIASFLVGDDHDILVVDGYAGTGKTTALAAVIEAMDDLRPVIDDVPEEICVLLAPTGRAAKVLSQYANKPASTIHKCIYRQKSIGSDGFGFAPDEKGIYHKCSWQVDEW